MKVQLSRRLGDNFFAVSKDGMTSAEIERKLSHHAFKIIG